MVRYGGADAADLPVVRAIARDRVVDETADGLLLLSNDGTVVDCTQGAAAVVGVDSETMLGDPLASSAADVAEAAGLTDATGGSSADRDGEQSMEADLAAVERITGAAEAMLDRAETVRHVEATLDAGGSTRTRLDVAALVRTLVDGVEHPHATVSVDGPDAAWITATGTSSKTWFPTTTAGNRRST